MDKFYMSCTELALLARANLCEEQARRLMKEAAEYREAAKQVGCNLHKEEEV